MTKLLISAAILSFSMVSPVWAQSPGEQGMMGAEHFPAPRPTLRTITVSGESSAELMPDQVVLTFSVVSKDKDLQAAKKDNDAQLDKVLKVVHQLEIPKEKLVTSSLNINPEYRYDNVKSEQVFNDYSIVRSLHITVSANDTSEKLLSALLGIGINQVGNIEYKLADEEASSAPVRGKAFDIAKARAQALAQQAGGKLGQALEITTTGEGPVMRPMPMMSRAAKAPMSIAPTVAGMVELHESVTVTFALE